MNLKLNAKVKEGIIISKEKRTIFNYNKTKQYFF